MTKMMTTWIVIAISVAWLLVAESTVASPPAGPREAVEAAVVRVLSIVQDGQAAGAPVADRSREIRRIAGEMFDFDEVARRALSQHWLALSPEDQAGFVTLFRDILERAYIEQIEACGGERITFVGESIEGSSATRPLEGGDSAGHEDPARLPRTTTEIGTGDSVERRFPLEARRW